MLTPGEDPSGSPVTILVCIVGALAGGFTAWALSIGGLDGLHAGSVFLAFVGAVVLVCAYRVAIGNGYVKISS